RPAALEPLYIRIEPRPLLSNEVEREPPLTLIEEPRETRSPGRIDPTALLADDEDDENPSPSVALALRTPSARPADPAAQGVDPLWRVQPESAETRLAQGRSEAGLDC